MRGDVSVFALAVESASDEAVEMNEACPIAGANRRSRSSVGDVASGVDDELATQSATVSCLSACECDRRRGVDPPDRDSAVRYAASARCSAATTSVGSFSAAAPVGAVTPSRPPATIDDAGSSSPESDGVNGGDGGRGTVGVADVGMPCRRWQSQRGGRESRAYFRLA